MKDYLLKLLTVIIALSVLIGIPMLCHPMLWILSWIPALITFVYLDPTDSINL